MTWADDNHQYTAWGDGGGFGGTNSDGRVSLGVARVEGDATSYLGFNVWGGKNPQSPAGFGGKSYGIISVAGDLYMWVSPHTLSGEDRLYRSTDKGATWTAATWAFTGGRLVSPSFLQAGQNYSSAEDAFVYTYVVNVKDSSGLKIQKPGEVCLMRAPVSDFFTSNNWEFFAGFDGVGVPTWTSNIASRVPVFTDARGVSWSGASGQYNVALDRYLLITEHDRSGFEPKDDPAGGPASNLGLFEALAPWGPWRTVAYISNFGEGFVEQSIFFWNFAPKWWSRDGTSFVLVFTGALSNDSWNTVRGSLVLSGSARM